MTAIATISPKELLIEFSRNLPEKVTLAEAIEELQILAAIERGQQAAEEGRVITQSEVRQRFTEWCLKSLRIAE